MNVAPAQRLVSYLREFPLARPAAPREPVRAEPARVESAGAPPPPAVDRAASAQRAPVSPPARPVAASPAHGPAQGPRLPRGTLLNIVT